MDRSLLLDRQASPLLGHLTRTGGISHRPQTMLLWLTAYTRTWLWQAWGVSLAQQTATCLLTKCLGMT